MKNYLKLWWENPKKRNYSEDLSVDGRIILKWILEFVGVD
jgi:hypothetical protein